MNHKVLILLSEATPPTPQLLSALLPKLGYDVLWAANSTEALRHLRFEPIDVFLCDLGRTLHLDASQLKIFHDANPSVPFVLFSPVQSAAEQEIAARYGVLLYKPINYPALITTLRCLVEGHFLATTSGRPNLPVAEQHR